MELPNTGSQNEPALVPAGTSCSFPALLPNTISSAKNSCVEDELRSAQSCRRGWEGGQRSLPEGTAGGGVGRGQSREGVPDWDCRPVTRSD